MPTVALYNMNGDNTGTIELNESVFAVKVKNSVLHTVVKNYLANQRQGTQSTKTRAEVRGGGIKPWRQKGTGRARQGSIRSPQWTGGGVALGPKPRDYRYSLNKKLKKLALRGALSSKVAGEEIKVIDSITFDEIKTAEVVKMLSKLGVDKKALIVTLGADEKVYKSARNIKGVSVAFVGSLNVYEILAYDMLIISKDAAQKLGEVYAK